MTVRELVALLQTYPHQDDQVVLQGCDCDNPMGPPEGWQHLKRQERQPGSWPRVDQVLLETGPEWSDGGEAEEQRVAAIQAAGRTA